MKAFDDLSDTGVFQLLREVDSFLIKLLDLSHGTDSLVP